MKWSNKRCLVTGGAGFIGAHLVKELLAKAAEVIVVDNFSTGKPENIPHDCEVIKGNVSDRGVLDAASDIDYLFSFGAPSSVILFNKNPNLAFHDTLMGFINILEWAKDTEIKKMIYPSSGSVYGKNPVPHSEDLCPIPINLYGLAKLCCEQIASYYSNSVPNVGLRIFAGYGPGEGHKGRIASVVTLFLNSMVVGKRPIVFGDGEQRRDFVYIDDVIEAIMRSAQRNVNGVINVGCGRAYSFNSIIELINELLGKNIAPIHIPKPANYLGETLATTKRMRDLLDLEPIDLKAGLKKYINNTEFVYARM